PKPITAAPTLGEHTGARWAARRPRPSAASARPGRPLAGMRVVDFTAFWAGPSATHMLAALGADVIKVEGRTRPDGMRFNATKGPSSDRWWEWSPVFHSVNTDKRGITLDLGTAAGRDLVWQLIDRADGVVENFSPRVLDAF